MVTALATVIDLHSRRLAGWAIAHHMRTDLVIDALTAARRTRGSPWQRGSNENTTTPPVTSAKPGLTAVVPPVNR